MKQETISPTIYARRQTIFEQTSNEIQNEIISKNESKTLDIEIGELKNTRVNIKKLINYIKERNSSSFNWKKFALSINPKDEFIENSNFSINYKSPFDIYKPEEIWEYTDHKSNKIKANFIVELNTTENRYLNLTPSSFGINIKNQKNSNIFLCELYIFFNNSEIKISNVKDKIGVVDTEDINIAIKLKSTNINHFYSLCKELNVDTLLITTILKNLILYTNKVEATTYLLSHLREDIITDLKQILSSYHSYLLEHLKQLKKIDEKSIFIDTSQAIINILSLVGESNVIYNFFLKNQSIVKELYKNLDGNSEIFNQEIPSKLIFGSLLLGLSNYNEYKGFEKKNLKTLKFHGKYSIKSNLIFDNKHTDKIFLQQTQTLNTEINDFEIDPDGVQVFNGLKKNVAYKKEIEEGDYYSVLEPILLEIEENNTIYTLLVPAIYVKSLADEKGLENLIFILNLGFNLFLMIIGVLTLGTSTAPTALILAILDLGLSTIDTAIVLKEKELAKTEEGQQFLKIYNDISLGAALVSLPLFFKLGMKIIPKVSDTTKKFIHKAFLKIIIEKNIINFEKQPIILVANEVAKDSKNIAVIKKLQDQGVLFLKGTRQGDKSEKVFAIYDDVILAEISNTPEGKTKFASPWRKLKGEELSLELEQYVKRGVKQIGVIEYEILSTNLLKKYTTDMIALSKRKGVTLEIKWIDKTHPRFNETEYMGGLRVTNDKRKVILSLRPECPKITLFHERWHLEDFLEMGWKRYTDISKNTPWIHEQKVWQRIYKNRNKWSEPELVDAYLYYKNYIWEKSNFKLEYYLKEVEDLGKKLDLIKK